MRITKPRKISVFLNFIKFLSVTNFRILTSHKISKFHRASNLESTKTFEALQNFEFILTSKCCKPSESILKNSNIIFQHCYIPLETTTKIPELSILASPLKKKKKMNKPPTRSINSFNGQWRLFYSLLANVETIKHINHRID